VDNVGNAITYNGSSWSSPDSIIAGAYLYSVSCPTASFLRRRGLARNALTYNGSSWSSPARIDSGGNGLTSVSCPTASFCVRWITAATPSLTTAPRGRHPTASTRTTALQSVSCPTASFCAAVDYNGNALTYNGSSWSSPDQIDPGLADLDEIDGWLSSVSCPTASFCTAVDSVGYGFTYDGKSWSSPTRSTPAS